MTISLVVIGVSMGAMQALRVLLSALPANFPMAVVIVLHRDKLETGALLPPLQNGCVLTLAFPLDKEVILPGRVYIAPPDYHLLIEDDHFAFNLDEPVNNARPSIDVLFESAADACGAGVTGIILTGLGHDGAQGLAAISRRGGKALVQSPKDAIAPSMPLAALATVPNAKQLPLEEIATWLVKTATRRAS